MGNPCYDFPPKGGDVATDPKIPLDLETLFEAARVQADQARAHYSGFHVGAALWSDSQIFGGCNVENASYGLTICAERGAVMNWAAAGSPGEPKAIAIVARNAEGQWVEAFPCGACRQVLSELPGSDQLEVWIGDEKSRQPVLLSELLPHAFGRDQLSMRED